MSWRTCVWGQDFSFLEKKRQRYAIVLLQCSMDVVPVVLVEGGVFSGLQWDDVVCGCFCVWSFLIFICCFVRMCSVALAFSLSSRACLPKLCLPSFHRAEHSRCWVRLLQRVHAGSMRRPPDCFLFSSSLSRHFQEVEEEHNWSGCTRRFWEWKYCFGFFPSLFEEKVKWKAAKFEAIESVTLLHLLRRHVRENWQQLWWTGEEAGLVHNQVEKMFGLYLKIETQVQGNFPSLNCCYIFPLCSVRPGVITAASCFTKCWPPRLGGVLILKVLWIVLPFNLRLIENCFRQLQSYQRLADTHWPRLNLHKC